MKRPRCRQEDSDVGILTHFTLASQKRALEVPYGGPGALHTPLESMCKEDRHSLFRIGWVADSSRILA